MSDDALLELAAAVPGAPRMGLRERKKATTMRRVQQVAIEQFEEHGFDAVTIEHVAEAADVSPSTIYRYFGTKESLVLHDEFDDQVLAVIPVLLGENDVFTAFEQGIALLGQRHLDVPLDLSWRRTKIWMETPSVRAAGLLMGEQLAHQLTPMVVESAANDLDNDAAHIVCTVIVTAILACIENWHRSGGEADILELAAEAVRLIKPAWATRSTDDTKS